MTDIVSDIDGLMTIKLSEELLQLFKRLRWFQTYDGWWDRLGVGHELHLRDGARLSPYVGFYEGHHVPQFGAYSYSFSGFDRMASIGAYCSINWNVHVMGISHPLEYFSTTAALYEQHPLFAAAYNDRQIPATYMDNPQEPMPVIGNDVWIAQDVLLARGITIGDGAVITAGSVVVKDVLPYSIVEGAPAEHIRYRFGEEDQALLQWSRWWEYDMPGLMSGAVKNVPAFVASLNTGIASGKISKIRTFEDSFTDLIRSGDVSAFLANEHGDYLVSPATALDLSQMPGSDARSSTSDKASSVLPAWLRSQKAR